VTSVAGAVPCGAPITGLLPAAPETFGLAAGGVGLVVPTTFGTLGSGVVGLVAVASFDTDLAPHPVSTRTEIAAIAEIFLILKFMSEIYLIRAYFFL
jgi:hypothetical protein